MPCRPELPAAQPPRHRRQIVSPHDLLRQRSASPVFKSLDEPCRKSPRDVPKPWAEILEAQPQRRMRAADRASSELAPGRPSTDHGGKRQERVPERRPVERRPAERRPVDRRGPTEARPTEARPTEARPTNARPTEARPTEARPTEARPTEARPTETRPTEARPAEARTTEARPAEAQSVKQRPTAGRPREERPVAECLLEERPTAESSLEEQASADRQSPKPQAQPEAWPDEAQPSKLGPSKAAPQPPALQPLIEERIAEPPAREVDLGLSRSCGSIPELARKTMSASNVTATTTPPIPPVAAPGEAPSRRRGIEFHRIDIEHKPYVPEISLSRGDIRMGTSTRVQAAVKRWAKDSVTLSRTHRRVFESLGKSSSAPIQKHRMIPRPHNRVYHVARLKPKPAYLIEHQQPKNVQLDSLAPASKILRHSATDELRSKRIDSSAESTKTTLKSAAAALDDMRSEESADFIPTSQSHPVLDGLANPSMLELGKTRMSAGVQRTASRACAEAVHARVASHQRYLSHVRVPSHARVTSHPRNSAHARIPSHPRNAPHARNVSHQRNPSQRLAQASHERKRSVPKQNPFAGAMSAVFAQIKAKGSGTARVGWKRNNKTLATLPADPIYGPRPPANLTPRRLNWLTLKPDGVSKTIWANLLQEDLALSSPPKVGKSAMARTNSDHLHSTFDEGPVVVMPCRLDPDYTKLQELFFVDQVAPRLAPAEPKKKRKGVLDFRRIHNLEISLKGLGIYEDKTLVVKAVLDMNTPDTHMVLTKYRESMESDKLSLEVPQLPTPREHGTFTSEAFSVLASLAPSADEIEVLRAANVDDLSVPEQHLLEWSTVDRFAEKLACLAILMYYRETFARIHHLGVELDKSLDAALSELQTKRSFKTLLALLLKCGNYLNYNNKRAVGIAWSSIDLFRKTMAYDNSRSLLRLVAGVIDAQYPALWSALEDAFGKCWEVAGANVRELSNQLYDLESRVKKIRVEITEHIDRHHDLFVTVMTIFIELAVNEMVAFSQTLAAVETKLVTLAKCFIPDASDTDQGHEVLKFLGKFFRDVISARNAEREAIMKDRLRALWEHRGK